MDVAEIGQKMVGLCRQCRDLEALDTLFSEDIESLEATGSEMTSAETKGLDALKARNQWWFANHEIHAISVRGPFPGGDRFAVFFNYDLTSKAGPLAGKRRQLEEVGLYTVAGGKIVKEEFFYAAG